jgi:hypothetical protein
MRALAFGVIAAVLSAALPARASLTPSEAEQVRRGLQTATDLPRVRALIARPDLSADEAAAAMIAPMTITAFDGAHVGYLHDLVFSDTAAASRPVLAVASVRGALARADAILNQHTLDIDRVANAQAELGRIYAWVEQVAAADPAANVPDSARTQCARVLADHIGRNATVLSPQVAVGPAVARVRAQAAIAVLDLQPDAPTRRIDAADALALTGARRAMLVERGVLVLDAGSTDDHIATLRTLFDRLPALRQKVEAVVVGGDAATLKGRDGIITTPADLGGNAGATLLWGSDARSPPGDGWTTAVARGLAIAAATREIDRLETPPGTITYAGGPSAIAAMTAMLILNGPLAVDVAATRLLAGAKQSAASLANAIALLGFSMNPNSSPPPGLKIPVGPGRTGGPAGAQVTDVSFAGDDTVFRFRIDGHTWQFDRDGAGNINGMRRDGAPVTKAMLARP